MSVHIQKTHHPIFPFGLKLFSSRAKTSTVSVPRPGALTDTDLNALPKPTQLLVAHCLMQNNSSLTLLDGDTDACKLLSAGWLISLPSSTIGVSSFKFKSRWWDELRSLQGLFLTRKLLSELESYRRRKTALYPWVWQ